MRHASIVVSLWACAAFAQAEAPKPLTVFFGNGPLLELHTESTAANSPLSTSGSVEVGAGHDAHRFVLDKQGKIIFGYYIEAQKAGQGAFMIRIRPFDQLKIRQESWYLTQRTTKDIPTLAAAREFPPLRIGDAVQVDILYNPATGEKLYDVLKVAGDRPSAGKTPDPARELFSLLEFRVDINGKTVREPRSIWMVGGGLLIYLPGRGDYYLGISPCKSTPCQPSGWADHNVLRFHAGSDLVEVVGKSNVLQNSDYRTIWMYHDPESDLRQKLAEYRRRFAQNHPDVLALERDLAAAERRSVDFTCGDDVESLLREKKQKEKD